MKTDDPQAQITSEQIEDLHRAAAAGLVGPDYSSIASCLHCGYRLRGLPEHRCPECGHSFNPYHPTSMHVPGFRLQRAPRPPLTFGAGQIYLSLVATVHIVGGSHLVCGFWPLGIVIWCIVFIRWSEWRQARNGNAPPLSTPEGSKWWRVLVKCMLAATVVFSFRYYRCPHATTIGFGSIGISYSENGGPCHNSPHDGGTRWCGNWYIADLTHSHW